MTPQPVDPEARPRRDGYLERRGTWGEVTVGSLLATSFSRTARWRVIALAHPTDGAQITDGYTLWLRARDELSGQEYSIPPRDKGLPVTFLVLEPDEEPPPPTPAGDAEKIAMLVETLGAQVIATRDHESGEIHCPNYIVSYDLSTADTLVHLRLCHGIDVSGLEMLPPVDRINETASLHGRLHNRDAARPPVSGGFPHRHVPESSAIVNGGL